MQFTTIAEEHTHIRKTQPHKNITLTFDELQYLKGRLNFERVLNSMAPDQTEEEEVKLELIEGLLAKL